MAQGVRDKTLEDTCADGIPACKEICKPSKLLQRPSKQYSLGLYPTPIHRWYPPGIPEDVEFWIKRDDLSGMQLSGNKARGPAPFPHASTEELMLLISNSSLSAVD